MNKFEEVHEFIRVLNEARRHGDSRTPSVILGEWERMGKPNARNQSKEVEERGSEVWTSAKRRARRAREK